MRPVPLSRSRRLCLTAALSLAAGALVCPVQAELYRYVDSEGTTVYSQTPPPSGGATVVHTDRGPSDAERAQARDRLRGMVESDFDRKEDAAQTAEKSGKDAKAQAQDQAQKDANCKTARTNLTTLQEHGKGRLKMPDGKTGFLSKDQLAARIAEAQGQIKANCK